MTIKTREPGEAFMRQIAPPLKPGKKRRSWREAADSEEDDALFTDHLPDKTIEIQADSEACSTSASSLIQTDCLPSIKLSQSGPQVTAASKHDSKDSEIEHKSNTNRTQTASLSKEKLVSDSANSVNEDIQNKSQKSILKLSSIVTNKKRFNVRNSKEHSGLNGSGIPAWKIENRKPDTNRVQTEHKEKKIGHKADTKRTREECLKREIGHKPDTKQNTAPDTTRTQTKHKSDTNTQFSELIGLQRQLCIFVYRSCQKERSKVSEQLSIEYISRALECQAGSVKTSLRRLELKGILERNSYKIGRGGWSRYSLANDVFKTLLLYETEHKLDTYRTQTEYKSDTKPDTKSDTSPSSSSSELNINNIKTTTALISHSQNTWTDIDIAPLTENHCPFGITQIRQLISIGVSQDSLQESIYHFGWALSQKWTPPGGFKTGPLNFFMGVIRNSGVFHHEEYFTQRRVRAEKEKIWLAECEERERQIMQSEMSKTKFESNINDDTISQIDF